MKTLLFNFLLIFCITISAQTDKLPGLGDSLINVINYFHHSRPDYYMSRAGFGNVGTVLDFHSRYEDYEYGFMPSNMDDTIVRPVKELQAIALNSYNNSKCVYFIETLLHNEDDKEYKNFKEDIEKNHSDYKVIYHECKADKHAIDTWNRKKDAICNDLWMMPDSSFIFIEKNHHFQIAKYFKNRLLDGYHSNGLKTIIP